LRPRGLPPSRRLRFLSTKVNAGALEDIEEAAEEVLEEKLEALEGRIKQEA
jgi:hypothetical protein